MSGEQPGIIERARQAARASRPLSFAESCELVYTLLGDRRVFDVVGTDEDNGALTNAVHRVLLQRATLHAADLRPLVQQYNALVGYDEEKEMLRQRVAQLEAEVERLRKRNSSRRRKSQARNRKVDEKLEVLWGS